MSGHSKWASIKHQKAAADAKRGAAFTKVANLITISAKKGADPETNFSLRLAIQKAKDVNMPSAGIERAIKRGAGLDGGAVMEEIMYEAYGPGGVAMLIACATDNRNRTASDVRTAVTKFGGRMAELGSVAYLFSQKGVISVTSKDVDTSTLAAIEAGADDVEDNGAQLVTVYTAPNQLDAVRKALVDAGETVTSSELSFIPNSTVLVSDQKSAEQIIRITDRLDELDDVSEVYANFEIDDAIADKLV